MTKDKKSPLGSGTNGGPTKGTTFEETVTPIMVREAVKAMIPKTTFKPLELEGALLGTYDLMTRVLLQNEMITTHDTARCIKENLWLQGDGIDLAIPKRTMTESVRKTLGEWGCNVTENGFTTKINNVPVRMQFVENTYDYFKMADIRPYGAEFYKIPNQWDEYWKNKDVII